MHGLPTCDMPLGGLGVTNGGVGSGVGGGNGTGFGNGPSRQQLTVVGYASQPLAPLAFEARLKKQDLVVSEHVPDTPCAEHDGYVQQNTPLAALWQPLAPLADVVEVPPEHAAVVSHVPLLPLPSVHVIGPVGGRGVGRGVGGGVGEGVGFGPKMQQVVSAGNAWQPLAPPTGVTMVPKHSLVFLQVPLPCDAEHDFTRQH
jgi:hypothetical protein